MFVLALLLGACGSETQAPADAVPIPTVTVAPAATDEQAESESTTAASPVADSEVAASATAMPEPSPTATAPTPAPTVQETPTVLPDPTQTPDEEPTPDCVRVTEFASDAENLAWFVVNDNVMGGRSSGGPSFAESAMIFEGAINTNGGGFSSIRIQLVPGAFAGFTHLQLRVRTDGRPYKVMLEDALETRDRRVSQQAPMNLDGQPDDGWQIARIDFADLSPRIFGRDVVSDAFRPDLANQLGIMLSDGVDGPFRLDIDWIDVCREPSA